MGPPLGGSLPWARGRPPGLRKALPGLLVTQEWRPDHPTKALSFVQKSANGVPGAPPPCGPQEGAPQASPRVVGSEARRGPRERLEGPGSPGVRGAGGCRSEAAHPRQPRHEKGSGVRPAESSPARTCVTSDVRASGASFQLRAPGKGVAGPEVTQLPRGRGGGEGFEPGPWAPAAWAPWAPARRPVRRWPGSRDHAGGSRSESTAGLGLAPSLSLKQAFLVSSPWQLYN